MNALHSILSSFEPISLAEMDAVKLMDRTDTKYTFHVLKLPEFLIAAKQHYRVLKVEGTNLCTYETLYFDTNNLLLYHKHHNGELNRYKIRHRTYVDSNIGFLEVKFKNNKGRTFKTRIKQNQSPDYWNDRNYRFLSEKTPYDPAILLPTVWVNYQRITLVSKNMTERVTIDLNVSFKKHDFLTSLDPLVIVEVKQDKKTPSAFATILKQNHISQGSISKYCLSIAYTCNNVKINNFKPKLLRLKRIISI